MNKNIIIALLLILLIPIIISGVNKFKKDQYPYPPEVSINLLLNNILTHINSELSDTIVNKNTNMDSLMKLLSLYTFGNGELVTMLGQENYSLTYHSEVFYEYLNKISSDGAIQENEWSTLKAIQQEFIHLKKEQSILISREGKIDNEALQRIYKIDKKIIELSK